MKSKTFDSTTRATWKRVSLVWVLAFILSQGCASIPKPEDHASKSDWMKAVNEYRKEYSEHPTDYEIKMKLEEAELNAAEAFYEDGISLKDQGYLDDAIYQFREGLTAMPNNEKIAEALKTALSEKEANTFYQQAVELEKAGKVDDAKNLLKQALAANPDHEGAKALLKQIDEETQSQDTALVLGSKEPIGIHFNHTEIKAAFDFLSKSFNVNILFDSGLKDQTVTLSMDNVTFEQALDLILHTTQTFSKKIGPNTILIVDDTKTKRGQYDDLIIKTIQLTSVKASDMANLLKGVIDLKHVTVDDTLNTLFIRDTKDVLDLVQELVEVADRPPAEVLLDVEILEADRNKTEQMGLDYGQALPVTFAPNTISGAAQTDIGTLLGQGGFTIPTVTLNYFKQDVDAKTLAHPQIRALDSKEAKIHIGNRVPLPSAVIQQTTGQVQTTYNYTDIGVLLNVTPIINLDRTIMVKLGLEVSSLGPNLGNSTNPAYEIGTRDADTTMILHDGETAILGGLIQDNDSKTHTTLPVLGNIPILNDFFTGNVDNTDSRTDILLTITPRIVRDWSFPHKNLQEIYSGTQDSVSSQPLFALYQKAKGLSAPKISLGAPPAEGTPSPSVTPTLAFQGGLPGVPQASGGVILSFEKDQYETQLGQVLDVKFYGENLGNLKSVPLAVAFNAGYLKFVSAEAGSAQVEKVDTDADENHGLVRMNLSLKPGAADTKGKVELVDLKLKGYTPGLSYLIFLNPTFKDANGNDVHAQAHASRVSVK